MKDESSIDKLKRLLKESQALRRGDFSHSLGKKEVAKKMKLSPKQIGDMHKRDGVGGSRPKNTGAHPDQGSFDRRHGGKKFKADYNDEP